MKYVIEGPNQINGSVDIAGNKNSALPCLIATLLTDQEVILKNIPEIEDVYVIIKILREIGSEITKIDHGIYSLKSNIKNPHISKENSSLIRASILFSGALTIVAGVCSLYPPGGDVIGRRRLDTHFLALNKLGIDIEINKKFHFKKKQDATGCNLFLDEASVTATENAIMTACLLDDFTLIENAASEPHIQDLCNMINLMGGNITGIGSNILKIEGVKSLQGCTFSISPDFMEVGSFIGLAAATRGELTINKVNLEHLKMMRLIYEKLGIRWVDNQNVKDKNNSNIYISNNQELTVKSDLGGIIPTIGDGPWPMFPPDLMSIIITVATQASGTILMHEKMFESRMFFVDKLISMGAKVVLCDPHRAVVNGGIKLKASEFSSPDVRAGMALLIAATCAKGKSVIHNIYQIERGYEDIVGRLKNININIEKI